ncbi:MAG: cobalamin-binding protein [Congregibacter sp.]
MRDFLGREVSLAAPAVRIVALSPHIVENVFSAGAGSKLVGVVSHSDYPAAATSIPEVGNYRSWGMEAIISLQPDLVLMWASGNGTQKLGTFEQLGIPVYVSEPRSVNDVAAAIRAIGKLAGTEAVSSAEAERIEEQIAALRSRYAAQNPLSVFYQVWNEPLQTLNGQHLVSSIIELCGGRNIFADEPFLAPVISLEAVLDRDPAVIVASGMHGGRPEWLDDWNAFPNLSAVKHKRLLFVNPDHIQRASARALLGAQTLCQQLDSLR